MDEHERERIRHDPELRAVAIRYLQEMLDGKTCPVCHQPLTSRYQSGKCVYGSPCNHRLYTGRLPKEQQP